MTLAAPTLVGPILISSVPAVPVSVVDTLAADCVTGHTGSDRSTAAVELSIPFCFFEGVHSETPGELVVPISETVPFTNQTKPIVQKQK